MIFLNSAEQAIQQIIVCFSFLNFVFVLALNKQKSFVKMLGLVFVIPLVFDIFGIIYPRLAFTGIFIGYIDLVLLAATLILILSWRWGFSSSALILVLYSTLLLFLIQDRPLLPSIFYSSLWIGGITAFVTALILIFLKKMIKDSNSTLCWGVAILGFMQMLQILVPGLSFFLIGVGKTTAYLLFFLYIFKKTNEPYIEEMKQAEEKLYDLKKTINYEVKKRIVEIELHNEHLLNSIQRDPLVDAYNRKAITDALTEMIDDPNSERFTVLLFDVDNFKGINDKQGHSAGDRVLKKITQIAKENIRGFDVLGRYGGDEFLIILPGTTISDALFVAERFRKKVCMQSGTTISIGIASYPEDGKTVQQIVDIADKGLYESKNKGKNTITHYKI